MNSVSPAIQYNDQLIMTLS